MTTDKIVNEQFISNGLMLDNIGYVHPAKYNGLKYGSPLKQIQTRCKVEYYCLACDKFMGKEHDFSECENCKNTPFPIECKDFIKLPVESEVK